MRSSSKSDSLKTGHIFKKIHICRIGWAGCNSGNSLTRRFVLLTVILLNIFQKRYSGYPVVEIGSLFRFLTLLTVVWMTLVVAVADVVLRVPACELLPASMHTCAVVKLKVSFHVRSVIRMVNVLQFFTLPGLPSFCWSVISHTQVFAVAITLAQVTLLSLELGCIYLKLRKPKGFFSTLKLVQTQASVSWCMALNGSIQKFMGRVQLCSSMKIDNQKLGLYQLFLYWNKVGAG